MITFTIPLPPITKKNSPQVIPAGRSYRVLPSKAFLKYQKDALDLIPKCGTVDYPAEVTAVFYMPTRRKVDLTNLLEALDDVLVKAEVLDDDNSKIVVSHDGSRVEYDKARPRTEVAITRIEEGPELDEDNVIGFLMSYRTQLRENDFLRKRVEHMKDRCESVTRNLDGMPVCHSGGGAKDGAMADYVDLTEQYQRGLMEAERKRNDLASFINGIHSQAYRQILTAVYLDSISTKALPGLFKKSRSWCAHTKKCALRAAQAHYDELFPT